MPTPETDPTYYCIDLETVEPTPDYPCERRSISDAAGLGLLAAAVYEIEPGEQLPRSYHYHEQREELFYVRSGTLVVETPDETFEIPSDHVFVAQPNSPHRPYNPESANEPVTVLGIGAPKTDVAHRYDPTETDATESTERDDDR